MGILDSSLSVCIAIRTPDLKGQILTRGLKYYLWNLKILDYKTKTQELQV